ncbi:MAG: alanine--tRNA ligase [Endomicrobiia bacterium]
MISTELRKKFLKYFENLEHTIVKSDSLLPTSDPTLLFTSAGMVQFKDNFLGLRKDLKRAVSVQKCFRTSDIERVGHTFRHLTFFEMLGNFSFGDYFKKEAIEWAWEFLTKECMLDKKRLYVTVYKDDDEAYDIWSNIVGKDRIYKLGEETNFWRMGDTGPCGPCSEMLYDLGEKYGCKKSSCSPACDCDRYLEVWNLVFTQFDCKQDGKLHPLSQKNIDTGMGLERLNMVVNNVETVFETDLFLKIKEELGRNLDISKSNKNYINAILDHSRAVTFVGSEGIIPSNDGRGYVLRKIIRRGLRYAKLLGANEPVLYKLVPVVVEVMKDQYPEIELHREKVAIIIKTEEEKFLETLDNGMKMLDEIINSKKKVISGEEVFKLYDTYGFPEELVREILAEHKITYDIKEFIQAVERAKELSRLSWKGVDAVKTDLYKQFPETEFLGHENFSCEGKILGIIKNNEIVELAKKGDSVQIIVNKTPFYGESGGQVGDKGWLKVKSEKLKDKCEKMFLSGSKVIAEVEDTKKFEQRIVHICTVVDEIKVGDEIWLEINQERRKDIMRHHTATHLLHKALRTVLGEHSSQSGSLVSDEYFRFDFIHYKQLSDEEIYKIEEIVNEKIMSCLEVKTQFSDIKEAKKMGAMALFEEKYGEKVRVVTIGEEPFSIELCGGTHCRNTGEIGMFKILSESSLGTNLRRIEAVCGRKVYQQMVNIIKQLNSISEILNTSPKDIEIKLNKLIKQNKDLLQELNNTKLQVSEGLSKELKKEINGCVVVIKNVSGVDGGLLRNLSDKMVDKYIRQPAMIILYSQSEDKLNLILRLTISALEKNISLDNVSKTINKEFNIKTGGRKDFIQGGGKLDKKLSEQDLLNIIEKSMV